MYRPTKEQICKLNKESAKIFLNDGRVLSGILTAKEENLSILTSEDESISFDADNVEKIEVNY